MYVALCDIGQHCQQPQTSLVLRPTCAFHFNAAVDQTPREDNNWSGVPAQEWQDCIHGKVGAQSVGSVYSITLRSCVCQKYCQSLPVLSEYTPLMEKLPPKKNQCDKENHSRKQNRPNKWKPKKDSGMYIIKLQKSIYKMKKHVGMESQKSNQTK